MNIVDILTLVVLGVNFILSTLIFLHRKENPGSIFFSMAAYSTVVWVGSMFLFRNIGDESLLIIPAKFLYVSGTLIALNFLYFSYRFLENLSSIKQTKNLFLLLGIPVALLIFIISYSSSIIAGAIIEQGGNKTLFGNLYSLYSFLMILYFGLAYTNLSKKIFKTLPKSTERTQVLYVLIGTAISVLFGLTYNIILPYWGYFDFYWLGPVMTIIFVATTTFAIFKHNLFNIKVIATEILTFTTWIFVLTRIIIAENLFERLVNIGLLAFLVLAGVLLVRSVIKEIESREQIEKLAGKLGAANKELERLNQAKSDFLSIASHQLKTPLSIIKGYVSMAMEGSFGKIEQRLQDQLQKVYMSNERLISLVNDLLNLSRIEDGRMKYDWTIENINAITQSVANELKTVADKKRLLFVFELADEPLHAQVDQNKIRNVIFNLIDNAIKYTEKGTITIATKKQGRNAVITVQDTGRGISKSDIEKLFQKFTRAAEDKKTGDKKTTVAGFGIGLYVAKLIVQDHKGKIWVESEGEEQGSTFSVSLPLATDEKTATLEQ